MKSLKARTIKVAISATIAILISSYLGFEFAVTSGIIAILSIQNTKKEAIIIAGKRILAAFIAILISYILYLSLGNSAFIFGLFLLIFIPLTNKLNIEDGIAIGAVLSTHLLTSTDITVLWIINEVCLTLIGISVAMIFNFFTISLQEDFEKNKEVIEETYKLILLDMSESLLNQAVPIYQQKIFLEMEQVIKETEYIAKRIMNNYIFSKFDYYVSYINMRKTQFDIIRRMKKHFSRFYMTLNQSEMLSDFTKNVAMNIFEENDCVDLLNQLKELRKEFQNMELPKTRDEFENRAQLYQYLNDLEDFLIVKSKFVLSLGNQ